MENYDVIVVGAGQAGISIGYFLKNKGLSFILLDSNHRIGESWRKRYESLVLFTPRQYSSLPGMQMEGSLDEFPSKDDMADYLEKYVSHFNLPVKLNTSVLKINKNLNDFEVTTNQGVIHSRQIVIASGAFQKPSIPSFMSNLDEKNLFQIHSSSYHSPNQLRNGSVLVVGGGNSGAQIAVELAKERNVTLAVSHPFKFLPLRFLGKSIFKWLEMVGLLYAGIDTKKGKWFHKQSDPIFGSDLKKLISDNRIMIKPRVIKADGNVVMFEDNRTQVVENIIWSTGFIPSYEWINIDGVTSPNGKPIHERGVSPIKGLYFIGLPWQYQRGSALVCGVGLDAKFIVTTILKCNES
jgi:putative flavoprotein involved in K+ transport